VTGFDYFVAELPCPTCGTVTPATIATGMQTKLRAEPELAAFGVGDRFEFDFADAADAGYLVLRQPQDGVRIVQTWSCPECGAPREWAEIEVRDDVITAIRRVELAPPTLARAQLVSDDAKDDVAEWLGLTNAVQVSDERAVRELLSRT
jgi:predicted RNA-binding Zn-ribbon protein involved in translation (DUF1610 family)